LAIIFHKMGSTTEQYWSRAGTKWNFLRSVRDLLVVTAFGGDPYYLRHKAESIDYHPQVILADGGSIDGLWEPYVADKLGQGMLKRGSNCEWSAVWF